MDKILSIIIPAFNMEDFLPTCLQSVLRDDRLRPSLDILVVNDGSKDRTSAIAHDFEKRHPCVVRVIDKPNGHYGSAVNAGLAAVNGRYVKILDADDAFDPDGLSALLAQIDSDLASAIAPDLYLTSFDHVFERRRKTRTLSYDLPTDRVFGPEEIFSRKIDITMHALTWRVGLLREIGYRQTEGITYTDVEWTLYPMLKARTIRSLPFRVYLYSLGREGQSMSSAARRRNAGAWSVLFERILQTLRTERADLLPASRERLLRAAVDMARMHLETLFVFFPVREASTQIEATLPRLQSDLESAQSGLGERLTGEMRLLKGSLNIPYLRIWLALPVGKSLWMRTIRGYLALTRRVLVGGGRLEVEGAYLRSLSRCE